MGIYGQASGPSNFFGSTPLGGVCGDTNNAQIPGVLGLNSNGAGVVKGRTARVKRTLFLVRPHGAAVQPNIGC